MVKETRLYDILGVSSSCTESEIKRAYRHMALKWHPDKNKHSKESTEKFQQIQEANQVLSDPQKRKIYDQYGERGLNGDMTIDPTPRGATSFPMDPDEIFSHFFGNTFNTSHSSSRPRQRQKRKGPDIEHKLSCTLEDLYKGKTARLGLSRTILCTACHAKGGSRVSQCSQCKGHGRVVITKQSGPMISKMEMTCPSCNGAGEFIQEKDICQTCYGVKTIDERKILKVDIQPGSKHGDLIVLDGEGDQGVNIIPGDVVVCVQQKKHDTFKRQGDDLIYNAKIDLVTALTGGSVSLKHLNGSYLKLDIPKGEVIHPGSLRIVKGYGMPKSKTSYGDLIIRFAVEFPKASELNPESINLLQKALPVKNDPSNEIPKNANIATPELSEFKEKRPYPESGSVPNQRPKKRRAGPDADIDMMDMGMDHEFMTNETCTPQ